MTRTQQAAITNRINMERRIVRSAIRELRAQGYRFSPSSDRGYDVEDMLLGSRHEAMIMQRCFEADECHLFVVPAEGPVKVPRDEELATELGEDYDDFVPVSIGHLYFVFGNDGWDVLADYTTNLEDLLPKTMALIDKLMDEACR